MMKLFTWSMLKNWLIWLIIGGLIHSHGFALGGMLGVLFWTVNHVWDELIKLRESIWDIRAKLQMCFGEKVLHDDKKVHNFFINEGVGVECTCEQCTK